MGNGGWPWPALGGMLLYALGIWRLIRPKTRHAPHRITIEVLERERGRMPLELRIFVVDVCLGLWAEAVAE